MKTNTKRVKGGSVSLSATRRMFSLLMAVILTVSLTPSFAGATQETTAQDSGATVVTGSAGQDEADSAAASGAATPDPAITSVSKVLPDAPTATQDAASATTDNAADATSTTKTDDAVADASGTTTASPEAAAASGVTVTAQDVELQPQASGYAAITLLDKVTGDPIAGVTFDFVYVDSASGSRTDLGEVVTGTDGVAGMTVTQEGRYLALYVSGLDTTKYSAAELASMGWEITVTASNDPGVQLVQDWKISQSGIRYRDIISSGSSVLACGGIDGTAVITIPGSETFDGNPIELNPANGKGVIVKVDSSTGKILWISQFDNSRSYSLVDVGGGTTALIDYNKGSDPDGARVRLFDTDGNQTGSFAVPTGWRQFDINKTSDNCVVVVGDDNKVIKYDLQGNQKFVSDALSTNGASPAKAIVQTNDGDFLVAGGGETAKSFVGKYKVTDAGAVTTDWVFNMTGTNARFNDAIECEENGSLFYVAVGDIKTAVGTDTYTIPGDQTFNKKPITISTNANGAKTAVIVKLNSQGQVVFAQSLFGADATNNVEQELDSVAVATDGAGGYVTAGKLAGNATVKAENSVLGKEEVIRTSDTGNADSIIVRWGSDGKYLDSYLYGTATVDDEYYAIATKDGKVWATGNDASAGIVQLSSQLTAVPRPLLVPTAERYKVTCAVDNNTGGTISGEGWVYYEECLDGAYTTKPITATPDAGYYLQKIEVNGKVVAQPYSTTAYTLPALQMDENKNVVAFFVQGDLPNYTVSFDAAGGTAVASQTVTAGTTATEPTAPTRDGYTFGGWFTDSACTTAYDFTTPVTADITLYAKWTAVPVPPTNYTVAFDSQGGSAVDSQAVESGQTATEPAAPTRDGYTFDGWFTDSACTTAYDFTTPVSADITLYAKWTASTEPVQPEQAAAGAGSQPPTTKAAVTTTTTAKTADGTAVPFGVAAAALALGACVLLVSRKNRKRD